MNVNIIWSQTLNPQCVQVKLEFGHNAQIRTKPTSEGFTHDWDVFVRGSEGNEIHHCVEKVVFLLHESFNKPKRGKICLTISKKYCPLHVNTKLMKFSGTTRVEVLSQKQVIKSLGDLVAQLEKTTGLLYLVQFD